MILTSTEELVIATAVSDEMLNDTGAASTEASAEPHCLDS